ncbi:MAG: S9 family peptidase [Candidatus Brocadiia bacterium]
MPKAGRAADDVPLIPREVLFGNPDRTQPKISPDGKWLAWLAPDEGVLNVWLAPADDPDAAEPITEDRDRGIRMFTWPHTGDHILYIQDQDGDENWRIYATDIESKETRDLTPFDDVQARFQKISPRYSDEILIGLNNRDPRYHDIHKLNVRSGELELVQENPEFAGFIVDDDFAVRFAVRQTDDGGKQFLKPDQDGGWERFLDISMEDALNTGIRGFNKAGDIIYMSDSRDRNTSALIEMDLSDRSTCLIAEDEGVDAGSLMTHPTEKYPQAASFTYLRRQWEVLNEEVQNDFDYLQELEDGDFAVGSRTLDDRRWVVCYWRDLGPTRYYLFDRQAKEARFLFASKDDLQDAPLVPMHPVVIESRDGLDLVSYYSLPPGTDPDEDGIPGEPLPMVLNVHGGPWGRNGWGLNSTHQWLANRGYAVLSVNFRGSTGFGKDFINAGNKEWAGKMHDDLIDAVRWAWEEGIADPELTAIMGASYGGYATLVGMTFTPETFACGVDIVGPSNLTTLLESIPPYWEPMRATFSARVGNPETEEGRKLLKDRSPLHRAEKICRPLLIGQGANDPRVKRAESDQIVEAMKENDIPVTYLLYTDEGHGFARPENRMSFFAVAEAFLAEQLGGRFQEIGDDLEGSSLKALTGAECVPGLAEKVQR